MIVIERVQFNIPSLFEFQDNDSSRNEEDIKVIGVKKKYIEYFSGYRRKEMTHIEQIVAEDFTVYDLQLDCNANLLSFFLEHKGEYNQTKVLEKVFQTFIVEYNPHSFGFFTIAKGKNRPRSLVK
ncbi:hypothetical protein MKY37_06460 [Psychrobacillus sp. FSL K6-2836]|uniref:hypothetical protein n=1 Tax=Psychrobacillus sp. FSL K6-2836 TaxID=2921548 RepID=UPI0030F7DAF7